MRMLEPEVIELVDKVAEIARSLIMGNEKDNLLLFDKVQKSGIELYGMVDKDYDGVSMWNRETHKPQIYLDVNQSKNRQLFTLAHEIGHLFIDLGWNPSSKLKNEPTETVLSVNFRDKDKQSDTVDSSERIANQFAGAFLMPKESVEDVISSEMSDEEKKREVSAVFKVTKKAAKNRLLVLGELSDA
nr:ImmA/IrrE family metallo-endopeptidase [Streptococcus lutetiensis]